jgi:MFS family permease
MSSSAPPSPNRDQPFSIRSLAVGVFVPHSIMAIGQGATAPVIALLAIELGASDAMAGLIVGLFGLGALLGDVPAGILATRLGDRRLMLLATGILGFAALGVLARPNLWVYGFLVLLMGAGTAMFALGRLAYATELSPVDRRGRVMSTIGGTQRIGLFIGPLLGSIAITQLGLTGPFLIHGLLAIVAFATVFFGPETRGSQNETERPSTSVIGVLRDHRKIFATATMASVAIQVVRSSRQAIIPLWGNQIGLSASQIGFLFSVAAGMEVLMFYPVGRLMDRRGRKSAAIPSLILMSIGIACVPLTHSALALGIVASVIGFANGMGAGINMTLSADLSPAQGRSMFLGMWRMITDAGTASGPTLVAVVASVAGLAAAGVAIAALGLSGAFVMWRRVPETLKLKPDERNGQTSEGGVE